MEAKWILPVGLVIFFSLLFTTLTQAQPPPITMAMLQLSGAPPSETQEALRHVRDVASRAMNNNRAIDLLVLPRYWLQGVPSEVSSGFASGISSTFNVSIIVPAYDSTDLESIHLVTPSGTSIFTLPANNDFGFDPALIRVLPVFSTRSGYVNVSVLIDSQVLYPEAALLSMLRGAELLVIYSSIQFDSNSLYANITRTRAFENSMYVALMNSADGVKGNGNSFISDWHAPPDLTNGKLAVLYPNWTAGDYYEAFDLNLTSLRSDRLVSIEGDAYRRPYHYRAMCDMENFQPARPPNNNNATLPLKIALLQVIASNISVAANMKKASDLVKNAKAHGADIVVMPELMSVGYEALFPPTHFHTGDPTASSLKVMQWQTLSMSKDDPTSYVAMFQRLAKALNVAIAVTYLQQWEGPPRNAVTLFDRFGREIFTYGKVHTVNWQPSEGSTTPGNRWYTNLLDTERAGNVSVGAMICYDRERPESARILSAELGAEVILVPNACFWDETRSRQVQARAYENAAIVAMANYARDPFKPLYNGQSLLFDHEGVQLDRAGTDPVILMHEVDIQLLRKYRSESDLARAMLTKKHAPDFCNLMRLGAFQGPSWYNRGVGCNI